MALALNLSDFFFQNFQNAKKKNWGLTQEFVFSCLKLRIIENGAILEDEKNAILKTLYYTLSCTPQLSKKGT